MNQGRISAQVLLSLLIMMFLMVIGCGGGGGGGDSAPVVNATITGKVSGTTVVAINEFNAQVARVTATGATSPKAFTLIVPIGYTYRFYLIENEDTLDEKIFPLYQGTTNSFAITSQETIDLGLIDTTSGVATPTNPLLGPGVSSKGENTSVPETVLLETLPASAANASLSSLVASGLSSLSQGSIFKAKAYFKAAVTKGATDTSNDADTAKVFCVVTQLAGINLYSDGNSADFNSAGDILDRVGYSPGGRNFYHSTFVLPETLPTGAFPSGSGTRASLEDNLISQLNVALTLLDGGVYGIIRIPAVNSTFYREWTNPINSTKPYKSDYADVLVLKAAIKSTLAAIYIQRAYDLDADIAAEFNKKSTVQAFLSSHLSFLTLASGYLTNLLTAKTYLSSADDYLVAAIDKIKTRNPDNYFINFGDATTTEINNARTDLVNAKLSLTSQQTVYEGKDGIFGTADDVIINLSPFFAGLDLRNPNLLPPFTDNTAGKLPDPTMKGIIVGGTDANNNGIPDILE